MAVETDPWDARWVTLAVGIGFIAVALVAYTLSSPIRYYDHFVWQAAAFLDGRAAIDWPVGSQDACAPLENACFQDVMPVFGPDGQITGGLLPFPPLPAIVLMPFVALWGLSTNEHAIGALLGALDVGLAWWAMGRLPIGIRARIATTAFFGLGTVFWYTAQLGTTWYFAHIVAVGLTLLAIGLALGADPDSAADEDALPDGQVEARVEVGPGPRWGGLGGLSGPRGLSGLLDRRQFLAGLLFGLAGTARLSVLFGAPFFLLVGGGGSWRRRGLSAGAGAAIPVALLLAYNVATTGQLMHPAYESQYVAEAYGYPTLNYHPDWSIEDPRYVPQNLGVALFGLPVLVPASTPAALGNGEPLCVEPDSARGLFDRHCPLLLPQDTGMSVLLTSPAYLLAWPVLRRLYGRSRLVSGGVIAVLLIALFNLMHFSQGWVQFGYRFSNDFAPFALPVVALGMERLRNRPWIATVLVCVSIAINFWGVAWGNLLGW